MKNMFKLSDKINSSETYNKLLEWEKKRLIKQSKFSLEWVLCLCPKANIHVQNVCSKNWDKKDSSMICQKKWSEKSDWYKEKFIQDLIICPWYRHL